MKFFLRCYLSGCLLILISAAVFSQDSTRKLLPPNDISGSAVTRNARDTVPVKDSIPITAKDSSRLTPVISSADS
ncbi:MAG TPA: hypothetical protein VFE54_02900, partial [Mucilaginibacter sp.]|nr:hypothetical protein [Mucilaginibacter sp.]